MCPPAPPQLTRVLVPVKILLRGPFVKRLWIQKGGTVVPPSDTGYFCLLSLKRRTSRWMCHARYPKRIGPRTLTTITISAILVGPNNSRTNATKSHVMIRAGIAPSGLGAPYLAIDTPIERKIMAGRAKLNANVMSITRPLCSSEITLPQKSYLWKLPTLAPGVNLCVVAGLEDFRHAIFLFLKDDSFWARVDGSRGNTAFFD